MPASSSEPALDVGANTTPPAAALHGRVPSNARANAGNSNKRTNPMCTELDGMYGKPCGRPVMRDLRKHVYSARQCNGNRSEQRRTVHCSMADEPGGGARIHVRGDRAHKLAAGRRSRTVRFRLMIDRSMSNNQTDWRTQSEPDSDSESELLVKSRLSESPHVLA